MDRPRTENLNSLLVHNLISGEQDYSRSCLVHHRKFKDYVLRTNTESSDLTETVLTKFN